MKSRVIRAALGGPRRALLFLLAFALGACGHSPSTLEGFPAYPAETGPTALRKVSDAVAVDLERIDAAVADAAPRSGDSTAEGTPLERAALEALLETYLALSAERISTKEPPQIATTPYPPIVRYPRLTAPALIEAEPIQTAEGSRLTWVVPIVFDKDALFWDLSVETVWFGRSPARMLYNDPTGNLRGWLVPHGEDDLDRRHPIDLQDYLVVPEKLDVTLQSGESFSLPDPRPNLAGGVLALPVADEGGAGFQPGFYNVQLVPRIRDIAPCETRWGQEAAAALGGGDWYAFRALLARFGGADWEGGVKPVQRDLRVLADGIDAYVPTRFKPYLDRLVAALREWARILPGRCHRAMPTPSFVSDLLDRLLTRSHQPIPILLDDPATRAEPFTFIAAGDLQFHDDRTHLHRFLRLVGAYGNADEVARSPHLSPEVRAKLADLKFIVITGDFGDGAGLSSNTHTAIVAGLGLLPPLSPYDKEFPVVRTELERTKVPVVAVPGNHDGFANYGGILNNAFDWAGQLLKLPPEPFRYLTHPIGHGLEEVGHYLPTLVKVGRLARHPYYDGLVQWVYEFGPLNVAFEYRDCSFLAFNSYNLPQLYRDQIGPIANNWGGGVQPADALWFHAISRRQYERIREKGAAPGMQFVFMHHDPRAAVPDPKHSGKEIGYGRYDTSDTFFNTLTFGWAGINYSPLNPLFVPIVTPVGSNLTRIATTGDRFNQEWMGPACYSDKHCHNARLLVEAINENLEGAGADEGGIHHVFFAHNDDRAEGWWASKEQGGAVFQTESGQRWTGAHYGWAEPLTPLVKLRTVEPFEWGRDMKVPPGRNARVTRMDDLGDNGSDEHGFHLVTVYPRPGQKPVVVLTHVVIPPEAPATPPR